MQTLGVGNSCVIFIKCSFSGNDGPAVVDRTEMYSGPRVMPAPVYLPNQTKHGGYYEDRQWKSSYSNSDIDNRFQDRSRKS